MKELGSVTFATVVSSETLNFRCLIMHVLYLKASVKSWTLAGSGPI